LDKPNCCTRTMVGAPSCGRMAGTGSRENIARRAWGRRRPATFIERGWPGGAMRCHWFSKTGRGVAPDRFTLPIVTRNPQVFYRKKGPSPRTKIRKRMFVGPAVPQEEHIMLHIASLIAVLAFRLRPTRHRTRMWSRTRSKVSPSPSNAQFSARVW
jgi:hypothetical protein